MILINQKALKGKFYTLLLYNLNIFAITLDFDNL